MTDDSQSPPPPRLPDEYYVPADIRKLLGQVPPASAHGQERRTELDARLAVMVASELHCVTGELGTLTTALREGATALNATVKAGNRLSRLIFALNWLVVLLMGVQIWLALPRH